MRVISEQQISTQKYRSILESLNDSINYWCINGVGFFKFCGESKNCFLDSLICFNTDTSRFIGSILKQQLLKGGVGDDVDVIYGEKIKGVWYFFQGDNYFILRSSFEGQDVNTPLSYQQLHDAALKSLYVGYLLPNGKINEAWFIHHFEGIGWGDFNHQTKENEWYLKGRRFNNRKEFFEAMHLNQVQGKWASRDTTKPIIPLPAKNLP